MNVLELFQEGRLSEALAAQQRVVDAAEHDAAARLLLAELLLFAGNLDGVHREMVCLPRIHPEMGEYCRSYQHLLDAERIRQRLLVDGEPAFFQPRTSSLEFRLKAVAALRRGDGRGAQRQLDKAETCTPWLTGHIDGREFDGMRDVDELFGPVLEAIIDGQYGWIPAEEIRRLRILEVESLRDRYFVPALLTTWTTAERHVHLPAFYAGSEFAEVGFGTDFQAASDGPTRGVGLRQLLFGEEELSLFDFEMWECRRV